MKGNLSKFPAGMPWGPLAALTLGGMAMSAYLIVNDLDRPKWVLPAENQLRYASGTFLPKQPGGAYVFRTDGGSTLSLGCEPQGFSVDCFDIGRVGDSTDRSLSLGNFYVYNFIRPHLSNVLVTVSSDVRRLLRYSDRKRQIDDWARRENEFPRLFVFVGFDLIPLIVCLAISFAAFRSRINRYKLQGPWGSREEII
jgi:hypothetical protein